ncbi:MAG: hypothetical protein JNL70_04545 [Saprospiraceae bacterium]|nr:hypothetical protein [Saprospiraceae bacterium]
MSEVKKYKNNWDDPNGIIGEDQSKTLKKVFKVGQVFDYEYDFGSTTQLTIHVLAEYKLAVTEGIKLLSRNEPLKIMCEVCGEKAATDVCTIHDWEEASLFCKSCAKKHAKECEDFADYAGLKVVNSPRFGVCAYEGGQIDKKRDGVWKLQATPQSIAPKVEKKATAKTVKVASDSKDVAKSSALIQKEAELKDLKKKKDKVIKSIQTTKTKLEELQTDVDTASKEMMNGMQRMADLSILSKEIKGLLKDLKKKVKLSKKDKQELDEVIGSVILDEMSEEVDAVFEQTQFGSAENFKSGQFNFDEKDFTDEFNRKRRHEMFDAFSVKPSESEQKEIRKTFVSLAGRFHPDKAENDEELKLFNDLMQSINSAYQRGDLAELLDIQQRFADYKTNEGASSDYDIPILDVLDEQILKQRNEITLLDSQLIRLKDELKNLKSSDLGHLVKTNKNAARDNQGTTTDLADGTQFMFEMLTEIKIVLTQWIENGKKPVAFNQFADGTHPIIQKGREQGMINDGLDMFDFDSDGGDEMEISEEEMAELMSFFNAMAQNTPKRNRRKR